MTKCLKLTQNQHARYCKAIENHSGFNRFWIIDNSAPVLELIAKCNSKSVDNISTFDFSTLYTSIPHSKLKEAIVWTIKKAFLGANKKYINVSNSRVFWSDKPLSKTYKGTTVQVTEGKLMDMITFLIDNIYVKCGTKVFRQVIGIPMGTDCAPFLANLFLYFYEFHFMEKMAKAKNPDIYRFRRVQRYLDDLIIVNGGDVMSVYAPDIYPSELVLKLENNDDQMTSFLDLFFTIMNKKIRHSLYDKRDEFPFDIVNYPNLSGNIYARYAYGVLIGQLLRMRGIRRLCQKE